MKVSCSVYGPAQSKLPRLEAFEGLSIEVDFSFVGDRAVVKLERNYRSFVKTVLKSCVDVKKYPRLLLLVKLDVICSQGGVLASAINAAILALMDAGVSMLNVPVATSIAAIHLQNLRFPSGGNDTGINNLESSNNNSNSNSSNNNRSGSSSSTPDIYVDPILEEEQVAAILGTVVTVERRGGGEEDVLCLNFSGGGVDSSCINRISQIAAESAFMTRIFFRSLYK